MSLLPDAHHFRLKEVAKLAEHLRSFRKTSTDKNDKASSQQPEKDTSKETTASSKETTESKVKPASQENPAPEDKQPPENFCLSSNQYERSRRHNQTTSNPLT